MVLAALRKLFAGELLEPGEVHYAVIFWTCFWLFCHFIFWPTWHQCKSDPLSVGRHAQDIVFLPTPVERYRRRLCRSQVYCAIAVVGGCRLLSRCEQWPKDLLYAYNSEYQLLFSMAAGHWIISIWEDAQSKAFLSAGLDRESKVEGLAPVSPTDFLSSAYVLHHVAAGSGYVAMLYLQACTGVGVFGLIFELPVLFMNHREFIIVAATRPSWYRDRKVIRFWIVLQLMFALGRYTPTGFYIYSLIFWQEDIGALPTMEAIVYHGMAIGFTILNYGLHVYFLSLWARRDKETYARRFCKHSNFHDQVEETEPQHEAESVKIDESVDPAMIVPPEVLDMKKGEVPEECKGQPRWGRPEYWIEIDGIAYDITDFFSKHPGGEAVLRKYVGKDATEGFRRAKHSTQAKIMMQQYMVGPVDRLPEAYRIFEHQDLLVKALWEFVTISLCFGLGAAFVGQSAFVRLVAPESSLSMALVPGLVLGAISGGSVFGMVAMFGGDINLVIPDYKAIRFGFFAALFFVGLAMARQPLPNIPALQACPSGLELAAVAVLVLEDLCEPFEEGLAQTPRLLAVGAVIGSWSLRSCWLLLYSAPGHVLAAALMAPSACWMARRMKLERDRVEMIAEILTGTSCAAPYCGLMLFVLVICNGPAVLKIVDTCWALPWDSFIGLILVANGASLGLIVMLNSAYVCSPAWATRGSALTLLFGILCTGVTTRSRMLLALACLSLCGNLSVRNKAKLSRAAEQGQFQEYPAHCKGTQAVWDQLRVFFLALTWRVIMGLLKAIMNAIVPEELCFYSCDIPIFDLGAGVDLGVAAYYSQPGIGAEGRPAGASHSESNDINDLEQQRSQAKAISNGCDESPEYFVCNVGHMDACHAASLNDMQRTLTALRDCWSEFSSGDIKGLLSNCVCVFPSIHGTQFVKEINLSAWTSAEAAHDWYVRSQGHRRVMTDHSGGHLRTFGNLLASLKPSVKIRTQDRCKRCARLVESPEVGRKPPSRCGTCNAKTFGYPVI